MVVKLLAEHHLEFLRLKGDCTDSSESTLVKIPNCWKSHAVAQLFSTLPRTDLFINHYMGHSLLNKYCIHILCIGYRSYYDNYKETKWELAQRVNMIYDLLIVFSLLL